MSEFKMLSPLPDGKFGAILVDPPWAFKTWGGANVTPHRTTEDHYETAHVSCLSEIPVLESAAKDCALFMWVIDSHLKQAIELGEAWGFTYKTRAFTWIKLAKSGKARIGMGYWSRKQTELCLLFTRGKPKRLDKGVREIIEAERREHSRKPDDHYDRIQRLVGGPYLEMFARQSWPGWSSWGNESGKFDAANDNSPDIFAVPPAGAK